MDTPFHDSTEPIYTLRIASKLSGTPAHSVRQYIDKGLLIPFRTDTNRHLFSDIDIKRLKCIKKMIGSGLNIAGIKALYASIPCWEIRNCPADNREDCDAFHSVIEPCWEASHKGKLCKNEDCRNCVVYKMPSDCKSTKTIIRELLEKTKEDKS